MLPILEEGAKELGIELSQEQLLQFHRYYEILSDWADRVSLTTVKDAEGVQKRHFLESAALIPMLEDEGLTLKDRTMIDVGSGTGVPGIPLKILEPSIRLTLVEAKQRKAEFLAELLPELGLDDVEVVAKRAETLGHDVRYREKYSFAVAKALAPLQTLAELTLPFLVMGGQLLAPKGKETDDEVSQSAAALEILKGSIRSVSPIPLADHRQKLIIIDKDLPTPPRFPRRPGMPAKRPL